MTSQRQIEANRRNALLSTGPRTEEGKSQSRCNAFRHGLTAETVIVGLEDAAEYTAFETEVVTEYDPKSVIERELTRRLASLLWRLRRANIIEAGLFSFAEMIGESRQSEDFAPFQRAKVSDAVIRRLKLAPFNSDSNRDALKSAPKGATAIGECGNPEVLTDGYNAKQRAMATRYLRLANLESLPLERMSRYEASLWRQFVQVLFSLDQAKYHRISASRGRFTPHPPQW